MRKCMFCMAFFLFVTGLYAQSSQGVDNDVLNKLVKDYMETTLKTYLSRRDLVVTDITSTTDWNRSSSDTDLLYFYSEGRFRNFPIDGRVLSGRVTANLAVRRTTNTRGRVDFVIRPEDQGPNNKIILLVDDLLSDELRDTMVINHIRQHYERPMGISIQKERLEIFPDDIYSYVSVVVNNSAIKYLRFVFQIDRIITHPYDRLDIRQTQWILKRADEIFSCPFPDQEQIRQDSGDDLFAFFSDAYRRNPRDSLFSVNADFRFTSGIRRNSISKMELVEATDGFIKLEIAFQYQLGRLLSWATYLAKAKITYQYDFQENEWHYIDIEGIEY